MRKLKTDALNMIQAQLAIVEFVKVWWPAYDATPGSNQDRLVDDLLLDAMPDLVHELATWARDELERLEARKFELLDEFEVQVGKEWKAGKVTTHNGPGIAVDGDTRAVVDTRPLASELKELEELLMACAVVDS